MQYGESIDVADWFAGFCQVYGRSIVAPTAEATAEGAPEASGKGMPSGRGRRGPRGSRKVFQVQYSMSRRVHAAWYMHRN